MASGPTGRRDESVQFSLKELLKLEDERLEEQARVDEAREAAAAREREELERRRRAEADAASRADAETRERERRTELEELARREAMQKAIVEQSRLEVEVRARAEERERERRHEVEIERLRSEGKKGASMGPLASAAAMGGAIMLVVALASHFGVTKPAADRRVAELEQGLGLAEARALELARRIDEQRDAIGERDRRLAEARAEIGALEARRPAPTTPAAPAVRTKASAAPRGPAAPAQPDCLPGDPMCFSMKTGR